MLVTFPEQKEYRDEIGRQVLMAGFWFVPVPRIASQSIRLALGIKYGELFSHEGLVKGHGYALTYKELFTAEVWNRIFTFGFVRNPWDRLASAYHHFRETLNLAISFEQFIIRKDWGMFAFPITNYLYDRNNKPVVQFIGRYENFNEDLAYIAGKLNIGEIGHSHKTSKPSYESMYTEKAKNIVAEQFKSDIVNFSYQFGKYLHTRKRHSLSYHHVNFQYGFYTSLYSLDA